MQIDGVTTIKSEGTDRRNGAAKSRPDLLRRFIATPHVSHLQIMQRTVRLETNRQEMQDLAFSFFHSHQHGIPGEPKFSWRLICESQSAASSSEVPVTAFSDSGLHYVNFGQRSFLARDLAKRQAIGFVSERYVEANPRFRQRHPLDILFSMTAAPLGLVALSAACAGWQGRGVLVFGPPNSGKTTASYLAAATLGLEFEADQVVFLDMASGSLAAWGDPFLAVFRPQTLDFLPELRTAAHPSSYGERSFFYFDKDNLQKKHAHSVLPLCSVFLERDVSQDSQVRQIPQAEVRNRLNGNLLFQEDASFAPQIDVALGVLATLPAYDFKYASDPRAAAILLHRLCTTSGLLG